MQPRRSVRQWIAGILKLQPLIDALERKAIADANFETGFILGIAHESGKPANASYKGYAHMLQEQASGAYARLLAPRPPEIAQPPQSAVYEQPAPTTDKIKAAERQRLFGTQTVPAVDNHGVLRKYNEQHKTGK